MGDGYQSTEERLGVRVVLRMIMKRREGDGRKRENLRGVQP